MNADRNEMLYQRAKRLIILSGAVVVGLWLLYQAIGVLLLFFFAIVLAIILNAPTMRLMKKGVPRPIAALVVFTFVTLLMFGLAKLALPPMIEQSSELISDLPEYANRSKDYMVEVFKNHPSIRSRIESIGVTGNIPPPIKILGKIGDFSLSVVAMILLFLLFMSMVLFMLINPGPLIEMYLDFFPDDKRYKAVNALSKASKMVTGWMWSNLIVGVIESILVAIFLTWLGVPGVWIWVTLTFFGELIPKLGFIMMSIPPTLLALTISPATALWVFLFFAGINELVGDFITPRIRETTMRIHPVSTLFIVLFMASVFGLVGALIATPLSAFIKAFYEEFYGKKLNPQIVKAEVDAVLLKQQITPGNNNSA